jgi:hypothetical protein
VTEGVTERVAELLGVLELEGVKEGVIEGVPDLLGVPDILDVLDLLGV